MTRRRGEDHDEALTCCERRALLRGLGAGGLLLLGRCAAPPARPPAPPDRGQAADSAPPPADLSPAPADTSFVGADGGLPPIDLAAPTVTQTATFALG